MLRLRIETGLGQLGLLVACVFCVAPVPLRAQSLPDLELEQEGLAGKPQPGHWNVALGVALASVPRYQGADTTRSRLLPLMLIRRDDFFLGPFGLGWVAIHWDGFRAGPVLGYEGGRRQSADPHLTGLGDISASITGGMFAAYRFGPFEIGATARQAITHRDNGLNALVRLDYRLPMPQRWDLRIGSHLELANAVYEQTHFGISAVQSEQSGLPVFTPAGGLKDVGLHASLTYFWGEHVILRAFGDISRFTADTEDSPIVLDRRQGVFGGGIAYRF
jgi:outer membrane scaffolding protein for murein synthesis (MipA/OmpV family)